MTSDNASQLPKLLPRRADSHKGDFGRALLIGGSAGLAGSISLSGMACLRSGAGLVKVATADACQSTVASFEPSYMTIGLPCDATGRISETARPQILAAAAEATVVACGPGLGRSDGIAALVAELFRELEKPLVVDADGLNALAENVDALGNHAGPRILTPHPGEFGRLIGREKIEHHEREALARDFALRTGAILVLKGSHTVITDGTNVRLNLNGNPGMATGGTGDVLTGIITALIGQGLTAFDAACLGVYAHGLAGDLAAAELGQLAMIASDLIRYLPRAWKHLSPA